ncbi:MAG: hypothetical protein HYY05_06450, partial [Chloroflexi bacterium]|nr:hypothetical protein [Chloroflexota bacterium]
MSLPRHPVLALVAVAFGLLVAAADDPWLGIDGGLALATSRLAPLEMLDLWARADHPPLYYLLLHYWMGLVGTGAFVAKLPSLAAALLAVPLAFQVGRRLGTPLFPSVRGHGLAPFVASLLAKGGLGAVTLGLLSAYLVAISFSHVVRGVAVRDYALGVMLDFASLYAFVTAVRPGAGRWPWFLYAATSAAALYTFYFTLPLLLAQGLYLLLARDQRPRLRAWAAAMGGAALAYLPWVWLAAPHAWEKIRNSSAYVGAGPRPSPLDPQEGMLFLAFRWLTSSAALGVAPWIVGLIVAAVAGLAWTQRGKVRVQHVPLLALGLAATLGFALAGTRLWQDDESVERFVYTALPFYAPLAAYGLRAAGKSHRLALVALLVVATVPFLRSFQIFLRPSTGEPLVELRQYLEARASPADLLLFTYPQQAGEFASVAREAWPWTVIAASGFRFPVVERPDERTLALIRQEGRYRAIWLVLWDDDPRNLPVSTALAEHAYPAGSAWVGTTYAAAYLGPEPARLEPLGIRFDGGVELAQAGYQAQVNPGGALRLSLVWRAARPPAADYGVFVHLVDGAGRRWSQHD